MNRPLLVRGRWWILAGILAISTALLLPPGLERLKTWRTHRLVTESQTAYSQGKPSLSFTRAQAALQLQPANIVALRWMARLLSAGNSPQAASVWKIITAHPSVTRQDLSDYVRWSAVSKNPALGEPVLRNLLNSPPVTAGLLSTAAFFYKSIGAEELAIRFAMESLQLQPDDEETLVLLCGALTESRDPSRRRQALQMLSTLQQQTNSTGIEAIQLIARHPEAEATQLRFAVNQLRNHPKRTDAHEILLLDLESRISPQKVAEFSDRLTSLVSAGKLETVEACRWLNRRRLFSASARLAGTEALKNDPQLVLAYLDSLAGEGRWKTIQEKLSGKTLAIDPALAALFQARCFRELNQDRLSRIHWEQALSLASTKPEALWFCVQYAEKLGERGYARQALQRLTRMDHSSRKAYLALLRLADEEGNTARLREVLSEMAARFPDDAEPKNDLAYVSLLLNMDLEKSRQSAIELSLRYPGLPSFRTTLALAHLKTGDPAKALQAFGDIPMDWKNALPGWQAVNAAVLASNNQMTAARQMAKQIPLQGLRTEERLLIQGLLN